MCQLFVGRIWLVGGKPRGNVQMRFAALGPFEDSVKVEMRQSVFPTSALTHKSEHAYQLAGGLIWRILPVWI